LIASESEGLSGADLQAVVYNAHLDVVQASIAEEHDSDGHEVVNKGKGKGKSSAAAGKGEAMEKGVPNGRLSDKKENTVGWIQIAPKGDLKGDPALVARVSCPACEIEQS
jgi:peroxin-1